MSLTNRHQQCLEALKELGPATAREVAIYLHENGYTKVVERNYAHPRLNELENGGYVKSIGTKWDELTERDVTVYQII